jgi:hypothetical protein
MESKEHKKKRRRRGNIGLAIGLGLSAGTGFGLALNSIVFGVIAGVVLGGSLWAAGVGAKKEVARHEGP